MPESLYAVVGYRSWDDSSFIAFLNDSLDSLYIKTFDYQINSIAVLSSNIIYATGKNSDNELILLEILILPGSGGFELYELCYSYPLKGCSVGNKIIITDDGDIAVVGNTSISPGEQTDIFLLKIGRYGVIWQRYFGGSGFEYGKDVINTMDGGFLVTGSSNNKAYIVKTDSLGFSGVERFELHNGWNLLSSPLSDTFAVLDAFPYAIPPAWGFDIAEGGYYCIDSVRAGTGFWLFSPIDTIAALCGTSEVSTVIDTLFPGWNLIGGPATDVPVGSLTDYEEVLSPIYSFDPESDEYIVAEYIRPGYGYWVLASDTVEIVMP
ncbi:hypothetical protein DRQ26_03795 [bacterium]|nr:MAG: hypothetical protein DRQ26_03795 [bacterium]